MRSIDTFFDCESDYPDLDGQGAAERLSRAIQCKTINCADHSRTDYGPFDQLHALIRASYPHVMAAGTMEVLGQRSLLITLPGSDPGLRPCLFMSHQDVVPVVEGTEDDWTYPAFSGAIAQGYIWGRGTLDIKNQVFGCLEAAEYLLSHGQRLRRTVYLAFGDDEETLNLGAKTIAEALQSRGVQLEFVLDEGSCTIESGDAYGAPGTYIAPVELMEKGYADLELTVRSPGGHSSRPFGGTSLGRISQAITRIVEHPFPVRLTPVMAGAFRAIAPYVTEEPLKTLVQDVDQNADAIARYCYETRALFPFVTTTIAPTVIRGSSAACNVMPQEFPHRGGRNSGAGTVACASGRGGRGRGTAVPPGKRSLRHRPLRRVRLCPAGRVHEPLLPGRGVFAVADRRRHRCPLLRDRLRHLPAV